MAISWIFVPDFKERARQLHVFTASQPRLEHRPHERLRLLVVGVALDLHVDRVHASISLVVVERSSATPALR